MRKIPVGLTIAESYGFAFGKYVSLLGIIWFPSLIAGAIVYFGFLPAFREFLEMAAHQNAHGAPPDMPQFSHLFAWEAAFFLPYLVASVGVTKEALGLRKGPRFFYFAFGMDELRIIGGYLLAIGFLYGFIIVVVGVCVIVAIAAAAAIYGSGGLPPMTGFEKPLVIGAAILFGMAFEAVVIFLQIRLSWLMIPVALAEHRFPVWRSWELSKGNVWRIIGIILVATLAPLIVFELLLFGSAIVPMILHLANVARHSHANDPAIVGALIAEFTPYVPYYAAIVLLLTPIFDGLMRGPSAFAYRSLMPETAGGGAATSD